MLTLHFRNTVLGHAHAVGPLPSFHITGNVLTAGREVAVHQHGQWQLGGRGFPVVSTASPTVVSFKDDAGRTSERLLLGPIAFFDGILRHGLEFLELLARLDEPSGTWHLYADETEFPTAVFEAA